MAEILVVAGSTQAAEILDGALRQGRFGRVLRAASGAEARRKMGEADPGLVLINAPLPDEMGDALAADLCPHTGVILIVKADFADDMAARLEDTGVMVLPKPVNRVLLAAAVKLAGAARRQADALRAENRKLNARLEELRFVSRAKCALIQYRGLTEDSAHKLIEREAMDRRITKREVALELLRTFEGL